MREEEKEQPQPRADAEAIIRLASASAYLLTAGVECCGCLGRLAVNPWFTFTFNVAAVCGLALCPRSPFPDESFSARPGLRFALVVVFCFLGFYLLIAGSEIPVAASSGENLGETGALVILDVESWDGKRLPIFDHLSIADRVRRGNWVLLFYHRDCAKCEELITQAASLVEGGQRSIALVEVPSMNGQAGSIRPEYSRAFIGCVGLIGALLLLLWVLGAQNTVAQGRDLTNEEMARVFGRQPNPGVDCKGCCLETIVAKCNEADPCTCATFAALPPPGCVQQAKVYAGFSTTTFPRSREEGEKANNKSKSVESVVCYWDYTCVPDEPLTFSRCFGGGCQIWQQATWCQPCDVVLYISTGGTVPEYDCLDCPN